MQNKEIKISVVIPVYNSEAYIIRTLNTVFSQSILPMEVVIADDGSEDNTVDVIRGYMKSNPEAEKRIRLAQQKNQGAGAARNHCIRNAHGNWLMFLDSDDLWEKNKIEIVLETIQKNPQINVVTHNEYEAIENDFGNRTLVCRNKKYNEKEDLFLQLYRGNLFSTSCMAIRRDMIDRAGLFDESLLSAQDYDFWIRIAMYARVIYLEAPLATYIVRKGNITSNTYRRYLCEMTICRKYIYELKSRYGEAETRKIVRKRIIMIHKVETYLAIKQKQLFTAMKILSRFIPQVYRKI